MNKLIYVLLGPLLYLVRLFNCDMKKRDLMATFFYILFKKKITEMELYPPTKPIWVISQHALKAKYDGAVSQGAQPL